MPPVPPAPDNPLAHAHEIARRVRERGYCPVFLEVVGDKAILALDRAEIPQAYQHWVVYRESELERLFGEGKPSPRSAVLRLIREAKCQGAMVVNRDGLNVGAAGRDENGV